MPKNCCRKWKEFCRTCRNCCYFWYALVILGMALSLYITVSSILQITGNRQKTVPTTTSPETTTEAINYRPSGKLLNFAIGNITGEQAAVAFITEDSGQATAYLMDGAVPGARFTDDRGEMTADQVHMITIKNLQPETAYELKICTAFRCDPETTDNWYGVQLSETADGYPTAITAETIVPNGMPFRFNTGELASVAEQNPQIIFGTASGMAGSGIVSVALENGSRTSTTLITLANPQIGWALDLANARAQDEVTSYLKGLYTIDEATDSVRITLTTADNQTTSQAYPYLSIKDQPVNINL